MSAVNARNAAVSRWPGIIVDQIGNGEGSMAVRFRLPGGNRQLCWWPDWSIIYIPINETRRFTQHAAAAERWISPSR